MKLVIDTNILLSALIRDGTTRKLLLDSNGFTFFYPEDSFHEIRKYKELVLKKTGFNEQEYNILLSGLLLNIQLLPLELIKPYFGEVKQTKLAEVDPDDLIFLASALALEDTFIWSDDKHFELQDKVKVFKTKDVIYLTSLQK